MTNEEAKNIIIKERDSLKDNPIVKVEDCLYEAFEVAIKALEMVNDFETAQIITGGRLNGRTYAYKCGLADGQQLAKDGESEQEPKWIPVSERLPEPNRLVLCYITTGATKTYFLAFWNDIQNDWEEGMGGCRLLRNDLEYEVIAWMPIMPYKTESEDKE